MTLLIATGNEGKLQQFRALLAALPLKLVGPADVGLQALEVAEDGDTLEANATHKARTWSAASGLPALADDTGLFVDALDGAPGVYPARWGGPGLSMAQRRQRLLEALGELPPEQRGARFRCVIAVAWGERLELASGDYAGRIAQAEMPGPAGFGYDSIFIPPAPNAPGRSYRRTRRIATVTAAWLPRASCPPCAACCRSYARADDA